MRNQKNKHPFNIMLKRLLGLVLAISLLTFCTMEIEETEGELGKEASDGDYEKALDDALAGISILNAKVGDSATYELNQRVELGSVIKTGQITQTLIAIKPVSNYTGQKYNPLLPVQTNETLQRKYVLYADEYSFDLQNGGITDEKHYEMPPLLIDEDIVSPTSNPNHSLAYTLPTPTTSTRIAASKAFFAAVAAGNSQLSPFLSGSDCDGVDEVDSNGDVFDCIKRFNLTTQSGFEPAPPAIRARPNCMDFPNCMIPVKIVAFDEVKWRQGKSIQTITLTYKFAKDVPDVIYVVGANGNLVGYMPPVVSFCQRAHIDYYGQDTIVTLCNVLKDMTRID